MKNLFVAALIAIPFSATSFAGETNVVCASGKSATTPGMRRSAENAVQEAQKIINSNITFWKNQGFKEVSAPTVTILTENPELEAVICVTATKP